MTAVIAVWNRLVQAIVRLYRSGLASPGAFAPPPPDPPEPSKPDDQADEAPAR